MKLHLSLARCLALSFACAMCAGQGLAQAGQTVVVKAINQNPTPLHGLVAGTVLVWQNPTAFYVHFISANPCKEAGVQGRAGYYASTPAQGSGGFTVQCTVAPTAPKAHTFGYRILTALPKASPQGPMKNTVVQCSGCAVDTGN